MDKLFLSILNMSLTGAFVIAVICLARLPLKKTPKIISYSLWAVAGFRLVFPFTIESVFSLLPFKAQTIPLDIAMQPIPRIDSGIPLVNDMISDILPAATVQFSANPLQVWTSIGAFVWLAGLAAMLIYGVASFVILKRKMREAAYLEANIYEAENIKSPFVFGIFTPKIYLPVGLSAQERQYVILHEQTHIQRRDHIVKLAAFFVLSLHWFNPLAWAAFLLMGIDMEMSCDEHVLREMDGETKKNYSLSLLSLATERRIIAGSPLAFGEGGIKARIRNALTFRKPSRIIIIVAVALVVVLSAGFAVNGVSEAINSPAAVGDIIQLGGFDWIVLEVENGNALVLSDKILFQMQYQIPPYWSDFVTEPITWEECDLRQYLNEQFYYSTFSTEEKERIIATTLKNSNNPWYGTAGGNDTTDKVFLLSIDEALHYFGDSGEMDKQQISELVVDDQFNTERIAKTQDGEASWWWFRSPGLYFYLCGHHILTATVSADGSLGVCGDYVSNEYGGVRPALWLKL